MAFNVLNVIDPHKFYYESVSDVVNKINTIIPLKKNLDEKSSFRFYYDDSFINIYKYEYEIAHKTFITLDIGLIKEAKSKNCDCLFIFQFMDDVYYWEYKDDDVVIGYNYKGSDKYPKSIHVFTKLFKPINDFI